MINSQQAHFSKIEFSDNSCDAIIYTNRPRFLHRLQKLHARFPTECRRAEIIRADRVEKWFVPYWWFNCRKRPQPQNPPLGSTFLN